MFMNLFAGTLQFLIIILGYRQLEDEPTHSPFYCAKVWECMKFCLFFRINVLGRLEEFIITIFMTLVYYDKSISKVNLRIALEQFISETSKHVYNTTFNCNHPHLNNTYSNG
jgi:hypothetical protein